MNSLKKEKQEEQTLEKHPTQNLLLIIVYRIAVDNINTETFAGSGQASEPSPKLRNPKDVPELSEDFTSFELLEEIADEKQRKLILIRFTQIDYHNQPCHCLSGRSASKKHCDAVCTRTKYRVRNE